ncbi:gluconate 2-dehydrogenase subunit 3 family protein [Abyssalbus ytuae]|uniref:Gluconate 2-dehydrogenase subunit 3 family protein n=1 Tax=Abyssalbus ytuae TaxID=2926907 RepID=A0A9E7A1B5_9FLAO|nr:gluconate 2-dehydrogenase subunit 3 family protein [Abyssalbus ytuae]UOB19177.1 gluconate 2-dehydrogenase subunit 3 family protein [Abyssalbus ytuae]
MNRRNAIKNLGFSLSAVVATPAVLSLLESCKTDVATWTPGFLTVDEGLVVSRIVDIIIPKTDTPSASEVNVPQFIDLWVKEVSSPDEQESIKKSLGLLIEKIKTTYNEDLNKVSDENYTALLNDAFKDEEKNTEDAEITEILGGIRWMTVMAYKNSEQVGENILAYDPIPGQYIPCGNVEELTGGKAWAL